jgi:membrane AbrB-like protein
MWADRPADAALLTAAAVVGYFGARLARLPAAQILGPILASGTIHALGWTAAAPPGWLVALAQLVIGVSLGLRFVGVDARTLRWLSALSALSVAAMLAVGSIWAAAFAALGIAPFAVGLLALAPGGVVEMGLIALSLDADPIFVTACHLARIVLTVTLAAAIWRRIA